MSTLVFAIRTLSLAWLTIVQTLLPQFSTDTMEGISKFCPKIRGNFNSKYRIFTIITGSSILTAFNYKVVIL